MTMGNDNLIELGSVEKYYPLVQTHGGRIRTLWSLLAQRGDYPKFRALHDISLTLKKGESLGLIGENGAGKSTLLKIIAGVVKPTAGRVAVNGRIGALLELGAGFHPEYTGRENIHLSAALIGIDRAELRGKIDAIIDFADIGEHIDQPIKHYSSGMVVRLGFAIVTALRPDVLITDEVLAVGDESFQKKCIRWMEGFLEGGGTLLLCSHSMFHVQKLCRKAVWIHHGEAREYGEAGEVTRNYLAYHEDKNRPPAIAADALTHGEGGVYAIRELHCRHGGRDEPLRAIRSGDAIRIMGTIHSPDGRPPAVTIGLVRADGTPIYGVVSDTEGYRLDRVDGHTYGFALRFDRLPLLPGRYRILAHAMDPEGLRLFDTVEAPFDVDGHTMEQGFCRLDHGWETYVAPVAPSGAQ
jgi:lipopolysaccharide transport system ATP-binding protein